jgi:hypothetical protein
LRDLRRNDLRRFDKFPSVVSHNAGVFLPLYPTTLEFLFCGIQGYNEEEIFHIFKLKLLCNNKCSAKLPFFHESVSQVEQFDEKIIPLNNP